MSVGSTEQAVFATYPSLRGRTAFVSGGASGLGAEFVTSSPGRVPVSRSSTSIPTVAKRSSRRFETGAPMWFSPSATCGSPCSAGGDRPIGRGTRPDPCAGQQRRQRPSRQGRRDGSGAVG